MNKPKQPLYYAVPLDEGTMVFAAWAFTQALETKNKLRAEYSEATAVIACSRCTR